MNTGWNEERSQMTLYPLGSSFMVGHGNFPFPSPIIEGFRSESNMQEEGAPLFVILRPRRRLKGLRICFPAGPLGCAYEIGPRQTFFWTKRRPIGIRFFAALRMT
jgi:hypothetical protein